MGFPPPNTTHSQRLQRCSFRIKIKRYRDYSTIFVPHQLGTKELAILPSQQCYSTKFHSCLYIQTIIACEETSLYSFNPRIQIMY